MTAAPTDLCALDEVSERGVLEVQVGRRRLAVAYVDGEVHVFHGSCPHRGGPLGRGRVVCAVGGETPGRRTLEPSRPVLMCPWHGWEFSVADGRAEADPTMRLRRFRSEVRDGRVLAHLAAATSPPPCGSPTSAGASGSD